MNLLVLEKDGHVIELLVGDDVNLSAITSSASQLFELRDVYQLALKDLSVDYSSKLEVFQFFVGFLKGMGVIGYPVAPMKDARLYAADKKITINSELRVDCNEC
jgi:hypothetical protein